jgi:hypothetical protein
MHRAMTSDALNTTTAPSGKWGTARQPLSRHPPQQKQTSLTQGKAPEVNYTI